MKMFMYSLEGDARDWYRYLPPSRISSLKEFHATFHDHCKRYFSVESLLENCCEEFEVYIQHTIICSSNSKDSKNERGFPDEEMEEDSISHESFSNSFVQEEDLQVDFYDESHLTYSQILSKECQTTHEEVFSPEMIEEISITVFIIDHDQHHLLDECFVALDYNEMHASEESFQENQEFVFYDHHSLQDTKVFDPPIYDEYNDLDIKDDEKLHGQLEVFPFSENSHQQYQEGNELIVNEDQSKYDEYPDDKGHFFASICMEFHSSKPMYDSYEVDYLEGSEGGYDKLLE
jgi:hypothetical protein